MNRPHVVSQPKARQQIAYGFNLIADMLAATLGPVSGPVAHARDVHHVEFLDDSSTVVRRIISLGAPQSDIGAMIMRNLVWRVGQRLGDGGAMAAVLAQAVFKEGIRLISAGSNAMQLAQGVRLGQEIVLAELQRQARLIQTENELAALALGLVKRRDLAAVLAEMIYLLGADSNILIDKLVAPYLERRYISGAHYKAQTASMYFYTDPAKKRALLVNPAVAILDEQLKEADQAIGILEAALQKKSKALLIIANDVSGGALNVLVSNNQLPKDKKKLDIFAAKLQAIGDERRWALRDLALMCEARQLGETAIHRAASAAVEDLGSAQRVEYSDAGLVVLAHDHARSALRQDVNAIQAQLAETPLNDEERPKLIRRLSTLTGGVGELKIGASSQVEREMLYEQAQRAIKVLSMAQRSGVLPGAGAGLHYCIPALEQALQGSRQTGELSGDVAAGVQVLMRALSAPLRQIVTNAGVNAPNVVLHQLSERGAPYTYDVAKHEVSDAYACGVFDVLEITSGVLQTAVSGALMALTTDAIVYHKKPKDSLEP